MKRPDFVSDKMLEYLDALRESGATNMFGAAPWIKRAFGLSINAAREVLAYWMETFEQRHPNE